MIRQAPDESPFFGRDERNRTVVVAPHALVAVVGSRDFGDPDEVRRFVRTLPETAAVISIACHLECPE